MKFGPVPVDEAEGAILAHSRRVGDRVLKKGRVLSGEDLALLRNGGVGEVIAARLEPGDVGEDAAARAVAAACQGGALTMSAAFTGRCNLVAAALGVVVYDAARLSALNSIDEAITLSAVPVHALVQPGQLVATIKIIPFAAPEHAVDACVHGARSETPLFHVAPLRPRAVGLIQTRLDGTKPNVLDKALAVTNGRLEALGCGPAREMRCDH
ncbi:MAG: 4-diphosphocytidyl-2C-methyl-D-erythritol kinase, partial [Alphaproteobacteria bacterium]